MGSFRACGLMRPRSSGCPRIASASDVAPRRGSSPGFGRGAYAERLDVNAARQGLVSRAVTIAEHALPAVLRACRSYG